MGSFCTPFNWHPTHTGSGQRLKRRTSREGSQRPLVQIGNDKDKKDKSGVFNWPSKAEADRADEQIVVREAAAPPPQSLIVIYCSELPTSEEHTLLCHNRPVL